MIISTTGRIEGRDITDTLGFVSGQVIRPVPRPRQGETVIPPSPAIVEDVMKTAEAEALSRLRDAAAQIGAHAITGMTISYDMIDPHFGTILCSARGTAVVLKDIKHR